MVKKFNKFLSFSFVSGWAFSMFSFWFVLPKMPLLLWVVLGTLGILGGLIAGSVRWGRR